MSGTPVKKVLFLGYVSYGVFQRAVKAAEEEFTPCRTYFMTNTFHEKELGDEVPTAELIVYEAGKTFFSPSGAWAMWKQVRAHRFDEVVVLKEEASIRFTLRYALFPFFLGGRRVWQFVQALQPMGLADAWPQVGRGLWHVGVKLIGTTITFGIPMAAAVGLKTVLTACWPTAGRREALVRFSVKSFRHWYEWLVRDQAAWRKGVTLDWVILTEALWGWGVSSRAARPVSKILFVRLDHIGDVVHSIPALKSLRERYPDAVIDVLVGPWCEGLARQFPYIDRVKVFRTTDAYFTRGRPTSWWGTFVSAWRAYGSLRREGYELVIDPVGREQTYKIVYLCGAPKRIVNDYGRYNYLLNVETQWGFGHDYDAGHTLGLSKMAGGREVPLDLSWPLSESLMGQAKTWLQGQGWDGRQPLMVVHVGANWPKRRWALDRFLELLRRFTREYDGAVVVVGSPDEDALVQGVRRGVAGIPIIGAVGLDLGLLMGVMAHGRLFLGNDSGPLHLAVAAGLPTVALFGPGDTERWAPRGSRHVLVQHRVPCNPCPQDVCQWNVCLDWLTVEDAWTALVPALAEAGFPRRVK